MKLTSIVPASFSLIALALCVAACVGTPDSGDNESDGEAVSTAAAAKKYCPIAVRCAPGYHSVDTDGDGCNDSCQLDCPFAIKCAPGYHSVDTDGDGCDDSCELSCATAIKCAPGYHSVDTDGDGCNDTCEPD